MIKKKEEDTLKDSAEVEKPEFSQASKNSKKKGTKNSCESK